jgi:hypothetical protein
MPLFENVGPDVGSRELTICLHVVAGTAGAACFLLAACANVAAGKSNSASGSSKNAIHQPCAMAKNVCSTQRQTEKVHEYFGAVHLKLCYEGSHVGFSLHRDLTDRGYHCEVVAPSSIPQPRKKIGEAGSCRCDGTCGGWAERAIACRWPINARTKPKGSAHEIWWGLSGNR